MAEPLVQVRDLRVTFTGARAPVRAVSGVDLDVTRGEAVALIGESGSGKSVTLRALLRLHPAKRTTIEGSIHVGGQDVLALGGRALTDYRGKVASMIFQEPLLALDPVYTVGQQIVESIRRHEAVGAADARKRALQLFERVRIPSPERRLDAYPHEMSGGMRQRAMIALALACNPQVLLADEPTTALDATVQIQILLLLRELQRDLGLSIVFVTHDIGAAIEVADRIAVMYAGRIVETGSTADVIERPMHPYTKGLIGSVPSQNTRGHKLAQIPGMTPSLLRLPTGCAFKARCPIAIDKCNEMPALEEHQPGHWARCWRAAA